MVYLNFGSSSTPLPNPTRQAEGIVKADVVERGALTGKMGALGWKGWLQLHPEEQERYWKMGKMDEG